MMKLEKNTLGKHFLLFSSKTVTIECFLNSATDTNNNSDGVCVCACVCVGGGAVNQDHLRWKKNTHYNVRKRRSQEVFRPKK